MKHLLRFLVCGLCLLQGTVFASTGCLTGSSCQVTMQRDAVIRTGVLCIGNPGSFDFGSIVMSRSTQTITGSFNTYFTVDDLKLAYSGYYTTVQMSGSLVGTGGEAISGSNIYMRVTSSTPTLIGGYGLSGVIIHSSMSGFQSLNVARQLILRNPGPITGSVGSYGVIPEMQLVLEPYQGVGTYQGTLVFTLYENS